MTATNNGGDQAQTSFPSVAQFAVYLQLSFASPVVGSHAINVYSLSPSGSQQAQCSGQLGVGWTGASCKIDLGDFPVAGGWSVVASIDGVAIGTVGFTITTTAPSLIAAAYLNSSQNGTDRQTVFQRAAGAQIYIHLVYASPLTTSHQVEIDFIRPDAVVGFVCTGTAQIGEVAGSCGTNVPQSPYPGTWTVYYYLDNVLQGSLTFVLQ
jgi:hypothetical protein